MFIHCIILSLFLELNYTIHLYLYKYIIYVLYLHISINMLSLCYIFINLGEMRLMYLYLRNQFGFREIEVSLFKAYSMIIMVIGKISCYHMLF